MLREKGTGEESRPYEAQPTFCLGEHAYTVDDVFDSAHFRGELQGCWRELLRGRACEAQAAADGLTAPGEELQQRSEEFRYAHDLVTAEETDHWLNARGITPTAFEDFFVRAHWLDKDGGNTPAPSRPLTGATRAERELLRIHTLMTGDLHGMARRLGQREAMAISDGRTYTPGGEELREQRERLEARLRESGEEPANLLAAVGRGPDWLEHQLRLEAVFSHCCRQKVSPRSLQETLARLRLPLLVVEYEIMEVDTYDAAREAYLSVTIEGMSLADLAHEYGFPYQRTRSHMEKLPENLQQAFISGSPGLVLPPAKDRPQVIRLEVKTEPTLADPRINQYIHRRILNDYLADVESRHLRWVLK
jgi:hypothetical protein